MKKRAWRVRAWTFGVVVTGVIAWFYASVAIVKDPALKNGGFASLTGNLLTIGAFAGILYFVGSKPPAGAAMIPRQSRRSGLRA